MGLAPVQAAPVACLHGWGPAGIKRPDYLAAFMDNIKWSDVSKRFGA